MTVDICETVTLPNGTKVLETKRTDIAGNVSYMYQRRGFPYNTTMFEKDEDGAVIGRIYP